MSPSFAHFKSLVLIAGISGAGKSSALDILSDLGFFKIDNLPVPLFREFIAFTTLHAARYSRTALLLDIDSRQKLDQLMTILNSLKPRPNNVQLLFMDSSTESVIRRYSETRRPHPGFDAKRDKTLQDTIQRERNRLLPFKEIANLVVDTSTLNIHALKRELESFASTLSPETARTVRINFLSFGFKYGVPLDCDLIMDIRFLPNPHFVEGLRERSGLENEVREYVLKSPEALSFVERFSSLLNYLLPLYVQEGKAYLNIGIGCTGGRHRSVVIAEELSRKIIPGPYLISARHRDMER